MDKTKTIRVDLLMYPGVKNQCHSFRRKIFKTNNSLLQCNRIRQNKSNTDFDELYLKRAREQESAFLDYKLGKIDKAFMRSYYRVINLKRSAKLTFNACNIKLIEQWRQSIEKHQVRKRRHMKGRNVNFHDNWNFVISRQWMMKRFLQPIES